MAWMARVYAHRFGGQLGPESSLAALERSLAGPVDGFEADVVLAADGEILAIHDPLLQVSTADLSGWAHEYPADVLTRAHLRDERGEPSDQRPLNLRQALRVIPKELPLQLDVKAYADADLASRTATRCCQVAAELGRASQVEVLSFSRRPARPRSGTASAAAWSSGRTTSRSGWSAG